MNDQLSFFEKRKQELKNPTNSTNIKKYLQRLRGKTVTERPYENSTKRSGIIYYNLMLKKEDQKPVYLDLSKLKLKISE